MLAGLVLTPLAAQAPAPGWTQFRGTPRLSGVATAAPPATLAVKWTYDAGESVESSAAIADGAVYVGSTKGELLALDLETGKLRWKYATGPNGFIGESSPAVHDGAVFVGDLAGTVHAVSTTDGKKLWTFATDGEVKASPAIVDDLVLIGSYDTHLYALDAGPASCGGSCRPTVRSTPRRRCRTASSTSRLRRALPRGARRRRQGDVRDPLGAYTGASTAIDGDRAFVGTFDADVFALDLKTRRSRGLSAIPIGSSPTTRRRRGHERRRHAVIVGGRDKAIHAIDAATGKPAWKFVTARRVDSSPALAGGRVYVGSSDGRLYVLDAASGEKRWEFDAGDAITASPAVAGGRVVVGAQDGRIYCFG
jgi:outer membrane protein assembly factor BamB